MQLNLNEFLTVFFTLFAVVDIVGSIPILITIKAKQGGTLKEFKATTVSGSLMILFLFVGPQFLDILGVDVQSFAVAGSFVIFILGLEMVLGIEFFKSDGQHAGNSIVPLAFPLIAGSGTLTTIISLKANYHNITILLAILGNLVLIYAVLKSLKWIEKLLGKSGLLATRKFFGVILLAIAVKIFSTNLAFIIKK